MLHVSIENLTVSRFIYPFGLCELLYNFLVSEYATVYFASVLLMDTEVASSVALLQAAR